MNAEIRDRLEYLRGELRAERISQGELIELQGLAEHIEPGDVELLEAAGVPEFPEEEEPIMNAQELVAAIRNVVAYALPDEERDAEIQAQEGDGTEGHIVHDLRRLAEWAG